MLSSAGVALFGGSFDPVHHGHLIVARAVAEQLGIGRVILLPTSAPPHKPDRTLAPAEDRATMLRLAVAGESLFEVDEFDLRRPGPTYSIDTVLHFRGVLGADTPLWWIIGADSLAELGTWHRAGELVDLCRFATARRPGERLPDWAELGAQFSPEQTRQLRAGVVKTPEIDIASTDIRARVAAGRSVRFLVPEPVRAHLEHRGLYAGPARSS